MYCAHCTQQIFFVCHFYDIASSHSIWSRQAVSVSPTDYRAWYGLGQTYEIMKMHTYAVFYYRKATALR